MVTTGIIAVAAAIAIPPFITRLPTVWVDSSLRDLSSTMQWARSQAISQNRTYHFVPNVPALNHYTLFKDNGNKTFDAGDIPARTLRLKDGIEFGKAEGAVMRTSYGDNVNSNGLHFTGNSIMFKANGSSSNASLYLVPAIDMNTTDKSRMRAISIVQSTGRIKVWRYDSNSQSSSEGTGPWKRY